MTFDALQSARQTIDYEIAGLSALQAALGDTFTAAIEMLAQLDKGRVIISGMGKSGHIGRKIAASMASTGTPAQFVHPAEASHGDLGMITRDDVILALSWSGETAELASLMQYKLRFEIPMIAITAAADSMLARSADICLALPKADEACPNGLAPTTSTTMQLALGDALTVALLQKKNFSAADFKNFHPGGKLGASLRYIGDVMHKAPHLPLGGQDMKMSEAIIEMSKFSFGCLGIIDDKGDLVGIITDGDLRRHMGEDLLTKSTGDIMTKKPHRMEETQLAAEALHEMQKNNIQCLFICEGDTPTGFIRLLDLLRIGVA